MQAELELARCPSCNGTGETLLGIGPLDWTSENRRRRGVTCSPCLACKATGKVEAYRVCSRCWFFKDACRCTVVSSKVLHVVQPVQKPVQTPVQHEQDQQQISARQAAQRAYYAAHREEILAAKAAKRAKPAEPVQAVQEPAELVQAMQEPLQAPVCIFGFGATCGLQDAACGGLLCKRCGYFCEVEDE